MPGRNKYAKAPLKGLAKKYVDASTSTGQPTASPPPSSKAVSDLIDLVVDRDVYYPIHSLITSYLGIDDIRNVQLDLQEDLGTVHKHEENPMEHQYKPATVLQGSSSVPFNPDQDGNSDWKPVREEILQTSAE
jgi:hypothetical protein